MLGSLDIPNEFKIAWFTSQMLLSMHKSTENAFQAQAVISISYICDYIVKPLLWMPRLYFSYLKWTEKQLFSCILDCRK